MDALSGHAACLETVLNGGHESRRTAQVVVGIGFVDELSDEFRRYSALHIEVDSQPIPWRGPAVGAGRYKNSERLEDCLRVLGEDPAVALDGVSVRHPSDVVRHHSGSDLMVLMSLVCQ